MTKSTSQARVVALAPIMVILFFSLSAVADDVASFATGGYAAGLRSKEMMNIIDTDGDGTISRAEWDTYQEKVFKALDTHKRSKLNVRIFAGRTEVRVGVTRREPPFPQSGPSRPATAESATCHLAADTDPQLQWQRGSALTHNTPNTAAPQTRCYAGAMTLIHRARGAGDLEFNCSAQTGSAH